MHRERGAVLVEPHPIDARRDELHASSPGLVLGKQCAMNFARKASHAHELRQEAWAGVDRIDLALFGKVVPIVDASLHSRRELLEDVSGHINDFEAIGCQLWNHSPGDELHPVLPSLIGTGDRHDLPLSLLHQAAIARALCLPVRWPVRVNEQYHREQSG
jgi:hypothetical protein